MSRKSYLAVCRAWWGDEKLRKHLEIRLKTGFSVAQLAKEFEVDTRTMYAAMREMGMPQGKPGKQ